MLGEALRLSGSNFRRLPNPTSDHWRKKAGPEAWKITRLMENFQANLQQLILAKKDGATDQATNIVNDWKTIRSLGDTDEASLKLESREAIHKLLDKMSNFLVNQPQAEVLSVLTAHISKMVDILEDQKAPLNSVVLLQKEKELLKTYFDDVRPVVVADKDNEGRHRSKDQVELRDNIWLSLMFRMFCWLLLHDFDPGDVNIVPSDLKGSRMPIFIG